jgi:uncharacterized iron-regulated membrane protein
MTRKAIFWTHLVCGVLAGLVILMMSVTGVILTYERQMLAWADHSLYQPADPSAERLSIEAIVAGARLQEPEFAPTAIDVPADPGQHVALSAGRSGSRYVDPYSGVVLGEGATGLREFFSAVTGWHRWFNVSGEGRAPWRAVTGASNLMFLFLVLSGIYLWLPRVYKWAMFRTRLFFSGAALSSGHARDFNWHHVLGIWSAVPLAVVVATAVVFSYPWGSDLVYRAFGEEPPAGGRGGPPAEARSEGGTPAGVTRSLDELFARAAAHVDGWKEISMQLPADGDGSVAFTIDLGNGGQPQRRHSLTLDAYTGGVVSWSPFDSQTPGRQARSWVRFLHTGEALGIVGQTVAGIVSFTSVIMVWTGLALAYRRLISPLFRRKAAAPP